MKSRNLKPSQRKALARIVAFYKRRHAAAHLRFTLTDTSYGVAWVSIENNSSEAFIELGPRGAIIVHRASAYYRTEIEHIANMLDGKVVV